MSKGDSPRSPDANPRGKASKPWLEQRVSVRTMLLVVGLGIAAAGLVAGGYLSSGSQVDGTVALNASQGPAVNFTGLSTDEANLTNPFPDADTIAWRSSEGNLTVSSSSQVSMNVSASEINGTWTNVTAIGNNAAAVRIDPEDKETITVTSADNISWKNMILDDGKTDFVIGGSRQNATITIHEEFIAPDAVVAFDSNGNLLDGNDTNADGNVTLTIPTSTTTVTLQSAQSQTPALDNPQPEGAQDGFPTTISVDVSDADFPTDNVTVDFEMNNTDIGTDFVTADGTASVSIGGPGLGQHSLKATATDEFGNTQTLSWSFSTPQNLTIRNASNATEILDGRRINATFFADGDIVERSTTTGQINMEGIPGKQNVIVSLEDVSGPPDEYHTVETLVLDFSEQTDAFMLNKNVSSRTVRFELEDQTGGVFADRNASVQIQKPVNRSGFSNPRWKTVFSDEFGPKGATATLEDGQRYRVVVRNEEGQRRVLGSYVADADETVNLQVGSVTAAPGGEGLEYGYNVTFDDSSNTTFIRFEYNDSEELTTNIYIKIYEFGNDSNVLVQNTSFGGPHGNFSFSEPLTAGESNKTWAVDVVVVRDGVSTRIKEPVGPNNPVLTGLPGWLQIIISVGSIFVVAGLFGRFNGHWGGLVVAGLGGMWWYVGFLPAGIGVVLLSMVIAGTIFLREREVSGV